MGWLNDLYQTYEANLAHVGKIAEVSRGRPYMLLPMFHISQSAHIEVTVDPDGNFLLAKVIDREDAPTTIPCTEDSASRTSNVVSHVLHDKLMYVAGDYLEYGGKSRGKVSPYDMYIEQLTGWVNSPFSNPRVKAIYKYVKKGCLIRDLVASSIIILDKNGKMIEKWTKNTTEEYGEKPKLYEVLAGTVDSAFVRFDTYEHGVVQPKVWEDQEVFDSFIGYYESTYLRSLKKDFCYVSGDRKTLAEKHPNGIRRSGDNAKLISANDTANYTFRGRFLSASDAAAVSYEVSQKAHNALKWLIAKQGKIVDDRVFLAWGNKETDIIQPEDDTQSYLESFGSTLNAEEEEYTHEMFAQELSKAIEGYKSDLAYDAKVSLLVLDSASPGRLAVLYYHQLDANEYFERIKTWHQTCTWRHRYRKTDDGKTIVFYGAPSTKDIAWAAYGAKASEKLTKEVMSRLLPCIVEGRRIPIDIVRSAVNRASNPVAMEKWEWEKTLSIACALVNKHCEKEGYGVALDVTNKNRDYLFGRLLAVADVLERSALDKSEDRPTNAIRYMNAFARHPSRTWMTIQANLQPYLMKLRTKATYFTKLIDEIGSELEIDEFNDKPLSPVYLLGFYSHRHELYKSKKDKENEVMEGEQDDNFES